MTKDYLAIVADCEAYLEKYGDCYLGVGWTKRQEDADTRYRVMLDSIRTGPSEDVRVLDFGCGASHLYEYIRRHDLHHIRYSGLDLSPKFLELSREKFPDIDYYQLDVLSDPAALPDFDYILLNGIFNSRCTLSFERMFDYFQELITIIWTKVRLGIAFNVMSKQVEWERDDLFHLPFDLLGAFLAGRISRHFVIRHDYGLWEYSTYVYRQPQAGAGPLRGPQRTP